MSKARTDPKTPVRGEIAGRKSRDQILKTLENDRMIRDYLEWLRRLDVSDLAHRTEESKSEILELVGSLWGDFREP